MNLVKNSSYLFLFVLIFTWTELYAQQKLDINTENLKNLIEFSKETFTDEIMLIHNNEVVCNWKNSECDSIYYTTASMVKSWTGLVIGILIDKGFIKSEEELVCNYIPEWKDGCRNQVSIKNLLTMSSGLNTRRGDKGILAIETINQYVMILKLDTIPNIKFQYSNESVQLLGVIIETIGMSANKVFKEYLFDPLGMDSTRLHTLPSGEDVVFGGAQTTIDDAVNIGLLMLNEGKHNNRQIVSSEWVKKSIAPSNNAPYYGYL